MSGQRFGTSPSGDERFGDACVVVADSAPLGGAEGGLPSSSEPEPPPLPGWVANAALATTTEQLRRGRWVRRVRVADDGAAREAVARLRSEAHAATLGPSDAAHVVGWRNRNRAISVGQLLAICFPWTEIDAETAAVVEIDPGQAFGAGYHPSTQLLVRWLSEHVSGGERVLDVGCGSGVLALVAARLGAAEVVGIDIEPAAVAAAMANARRNGLDSVAGFSTALVGAADLGSFEIVVANITADVLVALADDIATRLSPGGELAVSGLSAGQVSSVSAAFRLHGIELTDLARLDDWVSLASHRDGQEAERRTATEARDAADHDMR